MGFERKISKEAYFIFKMTGPTGQFGLLVSALGLVTKKAPNSGQTSLHLAPVVQRVNNFIQRINHCQANKMNQLEYILSAG